MLNAQVSDVVVGVSRAFLESQLPRLRNAVFLLDNVVEPVELDQSGRLETHKRNLQIFSILLTSAHTFLHFSAVLAVRSVLIGSAEAKCNKKSKTKGQQVILSRLSLRFYLGAVKRTRMEGRMWAASANMG